MKKSVSLRFSLVFAVAVVAGWFLEEMAVYAQGLPDTGAELVNEGAGLCWDTFTELCRDQPGVLEQNSTTAAPTVPMSTATSTVAIRSAPAKRTAGRPLWASYPAPA